MEKTCRDCKHFRLHYVKAGGSYLAIEEGHCVHPRLKDRAAETPACQRWAKRQGK